MAAISLALSTPSPARAQLDLSGEYLLTQYLGFFTDVCDATVVQAGTDVQIDALCPSFGVDFSAVGAIDLGVGTFSAAGLCGFGHPESGGFEIEGTAVPDGLRFSGSFFCPLAPGSISYSATKCGNGIIDAGEDCEPPGGCCSTTCKFDVGASCDQHPCSAGTCDATGVCVAGAPHPSGTACEVDGDLCTVEQCDGAGTCQVSEVVPCNACSFCDEDHQCIGKPRNLGSSLLFDPNGCWRPTLDRSRARLKSSASGSLRWRLGRESQTDRSSFGDPTSSTGYRLCVFYRSGYGAPWRPLTAARAEPGANWRATRKGFTFRDPTAAGGLSKVSLRSGAQPGDTMIRVRGAGSILDLPPDFTTLGIGSQGHLQIEIRADNGQCWGAFFDASYSSVILKPTRLRARRGG